MRNIKELKTILSVLYYLNKLGADDKDITNLLDYTFDRVFNCNTHLLFLATIGRTKEDSMPEINKILEEDTKYHEYIKRTEALKK